MEEQDEVQEGLMQLPVHVVLTEAAFRTRLKTYRLSPAGSAAARFPIEKFLQSSEKIVGPLVSYGLESSPNLKVNALLLASFRHPVKRREYRDFNLKTDNFRVHNVGDVNDFLVYMRSKILQELDDYATTGSGWTFRKVRYLELRVNKYEPLSGKRKKKEQSGVHRKRGPKRGGGGSGGGGGSSDLRGGCAVRLPDAVRRTKSTISVNNANNSYCFKYAVFGEDLGDPRHAERECKYLRDPRFATKYNWGVIDYPVAVRDIPIFERANDISINVYQLNPDDLIVRPLKVVKEERPTHRDILLYRGHYAWIKNLRRLLARQIPNLRHHVFCKCCLSIFTSAVTLNAHMRECDASGDGDRLPVQAIIPESIRRKNALSVYRCRPELSFRRALEDARPGDRDFWDEIDWTAVRSSYVKVEDLRRFAAANRHRLSVNIYALNAENSVFPLMVCKEEHPSHFDVLQILNSSVLEGDAAPETVTYFYNIKNFSALVGGQRNARQHASFYCRCCFASFTGEVTLQRHKESCRLTKPARSLMPPRDKNLLNFSKWSHTRKLPYLIFSDWECLLKPVKAGSRPAKNAYQEHEPCAFGFLVVNGDEGSQDPIRIHVGPDCVSVYFRWLLVEAEKVARFYAVRHPMSTLTAEEQARYDAATVCYMCGGPFTGTIARGENPKVRDHDHLRPPHLGNFLGAACYKCNVNRRVPDFLPVFHHGLRYDQAILIKGFNGLGYKTRILASTEESFISFSVHAIFGDVKIEIRFLDSYRFLPSSLRELANELPPEAFRETRRHFSKSEAEFLMKQKKLPFPYDHLATWDVLKETRLPEREAFYNKLSKSQASESEYREAENVWNFFNCRTMEDFLIIYLKVDVILLCEIYMNFREVVYRTYGLDPAWSYTLAGAAWQAFLKYTGVTIELLTDREMYHFFERSIYGGLSQCSLRYAEARNKELGHDVTPEESVYIMFFDAVGLYSYSLSSSLPIGDFRWMNRAELDNLDVTSFRDGDEWGYFIEGDYEVPREVHDLHRDLCFLPERKKVPGDSAPRLMGTLEHKFRYVSHILVAQQAVANGLILVRIHRGVKFRQAPFVKAYIELNAGLRRAAKHKNEVQQYKNFGNIIFGKTIQSKRNRISLELVTSEDRFQQLVNRHTFKHATVLGEDLVLVHKHTVSVKLDTPIFIGATVLGHSKTVLYDWYYGYLKQKFPSIRFCYTDTDSALVCIRGQSVYEAIKSDAEKFDFSNYPKNHFLFSEKNKKVPGKWADETGGIPISRFVGLRSKLYAVEFGGCVKKRCKGVKRSVLEHEVHFKDYLGCLHNRRPVFVEQNIITVKHQRIYTVNMRKIALAHDDKKRVILSDGIDTLPVGHYKLVENSVETLEQAALAEAAGAERRGEEDAPSQADGGAQRSRNTVPLEAGTNKESQEGRGQDAASSSREEDGNSSARPSPSPIEQRGSLIGSRRPEGDPPEWLLPGPSGLCIPPPTPPLQLMYESDSD